MAIPLSCLWVSHYVLGLTSLLADNVSTNVVGLGLGMIFRFWLYRVWVFAAPVQDAALVQETAALKDAALLVDAAPVPNSSPTVDAALRAVPEAPESEVATHGGTVINGEFAPEPSAASV